MKVRSNQECQCAALAVAHNDKLVCALFIEHAGDHACNIRPVEREA